MGLVAVPYTTVMPQKLAQPDVVVARVAAERTGVRIDDLPNPRNEAKKVDENDLHVANDRFLHFGPTPITRDHHGECAMEGVAGIGGAVVSSSDFCWSRLSSMRTVGA